MFRYATRVMGALALVAATGCGGGGDDGAGPAGTIAVSASPTSLTLPQGGSGTVTVTLTRGGGFSDPVTVLVDGLPTGVTVSVSPAQLTGSTSQAIVTVNVANTVAAGTYTATVRASATGVGAVTVQYTLTVTAVTQSRVVFSVAPTSLSIAQGSSGTTTLNVTRTAFTDNISPTVTGNPTGMTVTFNPSPITGTSSTATIAVGASTATGTHNVVIAAAGVPGNPSVTLPVTVTPGGGGGGNIVWEFCNSDPVPLKFWRKSNGTWAEVTGAVVGNTTRFTFTVLGNDAGAAWTVQRLTSSELRSARRAGDAAGIEPPDRQARRNALGARTVTRRETHDVGELVFPHFETNVIYATSAELAGQALICPAATTPVAKTFTVSGMAGNEVGALGYGPGAAALSSTTPSYNVMVPPGTYDWVSAFSLQQTQNWTHYRVGRGEVAPGGTVAINRTGATAFIQVPFTITGGAPGALYGFISGIRGARGNIISLPIGSPIGTSPTGNIPFLASADQVSTDMNTLLASTFEQPGANSISSRAVAQFFGSAPPASATLALPSAVPNYTVTQVTGGPYPTWTVAGTTPANFQTERSTITVSYQGAGETTLLLLTATRNWLVSQNMATSYSLSGPAGLTGFLSQWAPAAPLIDADVTMFGTTVPFGGPVAGSINVTSFLFKQPP